MSAELAPPATSGTAPRLSLIGTLADWEAIAEQWDDAACRMEAFYLTYSWLRAWWNTYGSGRPAPAVVWEGERIVALAPLRRRRRWIRGLPVRTVENMFNPHAARSDVGLSGAGDDRSLDLLFDGLDREPWDIAILREVPASSRLLTSVPGLCQRRGLRLRSWHSLRSPYVTIRGPWEDFISERSARFRKDLRNKRNRLSRSALEARYECLRKSEEVLAVLPEIMAVAERSWSGRRGSSVASPPHRSFYEGVVRRMASHDGVRIWTLRLGDRLAAFEIHLCCGRRTAAIKAAYDPEFTSLSPGSLLDAHVVEALFRSGEWDRYDLLGKDDPYKLRWTEEVEPHADLFIYNAGAVPRTLELLEFRLRPIVGRLKRRAERVLGGARKERAEP
jgi:CelD/BcsL family acetyltransferase involved in cellulose biosynthesis